MVNAETSLGITGLLLFCVGARLHTVATILVVINYFFALMKSDGTLGFLTHFAPIMCVR